MIRKKITFLLLTFLVLCSCGKKTLGPPELQLNFSQERILVVAPHCDDEILGCGGLLREAADKGTPVKIVLMTNGDGFKLAVEASYRSLKPPSRDYIEFGYRRQLESLAGLAVIGVKPDQVIFLGYPDGGLFQLQNKYWDKPYLSPYTRTFTSPYRNSFNSQASFCGSSVLADLTKIINDFKPTIIFLPHPADHHPDHQATFKYALPALEKLPIKPELYAYLIHQRHWPVPKGLHSKRWLYPPKKLNGADSNWCIFPLSPELENLKLEAIRKYRSQFLMLRGLLLSFVRKNELFYHYEY